MLYTEEKRIKDFILKTGFLPKQILYAVNE